MRLLLFDIDGTLIHANGAGRAAMAATLQEIFGTTGPIDTYQMNGKTDPRIITDLLVAAGIPAPRVHAALPQVFRLMAEKARVIYAEKEMTPCPGITQLLDALIRERGAVLGLLTGNGELTAPLKLHHAGLDPAIFKVGAYGSDHMDRNQLPPIAMQRATTLYGYSFAGHNTVIIGDTPADILCAQTSGATAVAVATGWHTAAALAKYEPDYLLPDLADLPTVLRALLA